MPKRPPNTITSILSNLHLLLRVPSFARWPLKLHFFDQDVFARWNRYNAASGVEPLRKTLEVVTDFKSAALGSDVPEEQTDEKQKNEEQRKKKLTTVTKKKKKGAKADEQKDVVEEEEEEVENSEYESTGGPAWGIHGLPLDHAPLAPYLEKGQDISTFEREGNCVVCQQQLDHDKGLYAICSNGECEGVGHLDCWSRHLLDQRDEAGADGLILPMEGQCPKCSGVVRWSDMMRELTLRVRGQQEVEKVLKKHRRSTKITKAKTKGRGKAKAKVVDNV